MSAGKGRVTARGPTPRSGLRLCLDVNVWVAYLMGLQNGRSGTVPMRLVAMVLDHRAGPIPLQLVMSQEMLGTTETVLMRLGLPADMACAFPNALAGLMQAGPEGLPPAPPAAGRDQLPMTDREDAGVLGSCITDRVDLLVTDNLPDFQTKDAERRNTRTLTRRDGTGRQLFTLPHEREDGVALVVAHPIDVVEWLGAGFRPTPDALRRRYP